MRPIRKLCRAAAALAVAGLVTWAAHATPAPVPPVIVINDPIMQVPGPTTPPVWRVWYPVYPGLEVPFNGYTTSGGWYGGLVARDLSQPQSQWQWFGVYPGNKIHWRLSTVGGVGDYKVTYFAYVSNMQGTVRSPWQQFSISVSE